jgi:hypothetical protein
MEKVDSDRPHPVQVDHLQLLQQAKTISSHSTATLKAAALFDTDPANHDAMDITTHRDDMIKMFCQSYSTLQAALLDILTEDELDNLKMGAGETVFDKNTKVLVLIFKDKGICQQTKERLERDREDLKISDDLKASTLARMGGDKIMITGMKYITSDHLALTLNIRNSRRHDKRPGDFTLGTGTALCLQEQEHPPHRWTDFLRPCEQRAQICLYTYAATPRGRPRRIWMDTPPTNILPHHRDLRERTPNRGGDSHPSRDAGPRFQPPREIHGDHNNPKQEATQHEQSGDQRSAYQCEQWHGRQTDLHQAVHQSGEHPSCLQAPVVDVISPLQEWRDKYAINEIKESLVYLIPTLPHNPQSANTGEIKAQR